jgi:hypothetical protein
MSQVGRPWDTVYSEICAEADARTWVGYHLRDMLDFYVTQNCLLRDGRVINEHGHELGSWWNSFYVHPETKTLEFVRRKSWRKKDEVQTVFDLKDKQYFKWEGIWYRVKFRAAAKVKHWGWYDYIVPHADDVFLHEQIHKYPHWDNWTPIRLLRETYGSDKGEIRYCIWKQAANSREIDQLRKKYGNKLI